VLVQETWDPAWHAYENGREMRVENEETMGFMLIDLPEGDQTVQVRFETPLENRIGVILLFLTGLTTFVLVVFIRKAKS
jgi:uncharacterized membrane protein YfhO